MLSSPFQQADSPLLRYYNFNLKGVQGNCSELVPSPTGQSLGFPCLLKAPCDILFMTNVTSHSPPTRRVILLYFQDGSVLMFSWSSRIPSISHVLPLHNHKNQSHNEHGALLKLHDT